jgi:hypothetical protein
MLERSALPSTSTNTLAYLGYSLTSLIRMLSRPCMIKLFMVVVNYVAKYSGFICHYQ